MKRNFRIERAHFTGIFNAALKGHLKNNAKIAMFHLIFPFKFKFS